MENKGKKIAGGFIALIGFFLSPLSWWNDIILNIPLAYLFAIPFGLINRSFFMPAMIFGYWCTNVLGFILMHYGYNKLLKNKNSSKSIKSEVLELIAISTLYTAAISLLVLTGLIKFPTDYFK